MIRYVICPACFSAGRWHLDEQDKHNGYEQRTKALRIKTPVLEAPLTILQSVICEGCNTPIKDGERAYAITHWRPAREHTPETWESHYGKIIE